jgi:predicted transcriptional regulator
MTKTEIKQQLHNQIETLEDSDKLIEIHEIINFIVNDEVIEWESLSEAERKGIEEGLKDVEEGRTISYEDFMKKHEKWFRQ